MHGFISKSRGCCITKKQQFFLINLNLSNFYYFVCQLIINQKNQINP